MKKYTFYSWWSLKFLIRCINDLFWTFFWIFILGWLISLGIWEFISNFLSVFVSLKLAKTLAYGILIIWLIQIMRYSLKSERNNLKKMKELKMITIDSDFLVFSFGIWTVHSYKKEQISISFKQNSNNRSLTINDLNSAKSHNIPWTLSSWFSEVYDLSLFSTKDRKDIKDLLWISENIKVQKVQTTKL